MPRFRSRRSRFTAAIASACLRTGAAFSRTSTPARGPSPRPRHRGIAGAGSRRSIRSRPRPRGALAAHHAKAPQPRRVDHGFRGDGHHSRSDRLRHAHDVAASGAICRDGRSRISRRWRSATPATKEEMYRHAAALEIAQRRELLLRGLRQRGVLDARIDAGRARQRRSSINTSTSKSAACSSCWNRGWFRRDGAGRFRSRPIVTGQGDPRENSGRSPAAKTSPPANRYFSARGISDGDRNASMIPATKSIGIVPRSSRAARPPPCERFSARQQSGKKHSARYFQSCAARDKNRRQLEDAMRRNEAPKLHWPFPRMPCGRADNAHHQCRSTPSSRPCRCLR